MRARDGRLSLALVAALGVFSGSACDIGNDGGGSQGESSTSLAIELPDLVVKSVKGPASAMPGSPFTAAVTVCNQGTAAGGAPVDLVLSADSTIEVTMPGPWEPGADLPVGGAFFHLEAGACGTQDVQGFAGPPGPDGAYYLGAIADLPATLPELIETNNARSGGLVTIGW